MSVRVTHVSLVDLEHAPPGCELRVRVSPALERDRHAPPEFGQWATKSDHRRNAAACRDVRRRVVLATLGQSPEHQRELRREAVRIARLSR